MKSNIVNIFNNIKNSVVNIFNNIKNSLVNIVSNMWSALKNKFSTLGTAIGDAISGAVKSAINWILNKIESVINSFFGLINSGIDVINAIPGVNIGKLNMLSIPKLARGGIVNQPTQAIIGEAGKEAVLPLENNTEWMDILAEKIASILNIGSRNEEGREIVLRFDGTLSQLIRLLKPELDRESNRRGDKLIIGGNS
jgi:phage-related protein